MKPSSFLQLQILFLHIFMVHASFSVYVYMIMPVNFTGENSFISFFSVIHPLLCLFLFCSTLDAKSEGLAACGYVPLLSYLWIFPLLLY